MSCTSKPTKYQPTEEEWKCPSCDAGHGNFYIDETECEDPDCTNLHDSDYLKCMGKTEGEYCDYDTNGKAFAALVVKRNSYVDCPHCKGKGKVKK